MQQLTAAIGLFLNSLLFLLSYLVPKRPGTLLLGGGLGSRLSGNTKYFFLHLCRESQAGVNPFRQFPWITKNRHLYAQLLAQGRPALFAWSLKGFWAILRAEQLVIESGNAPGIGGHDIAYERLFLGRFRVFQTWHGTPLKRICLDVFRDRGLARWYEKLYFRLYHRELSSLAGIIALSEAARQRFASAFDNQNVEVIGYPKNDPFCGDPAHWGVKPRWEAYDKVVLYAPTFRDHPDAVTPFPGDFFNALNSELKARNWCLLVKKHPFDKTMALPEGLSNIFDVSAQIDDVQELLVEADLLISDYSSVFIDYLLRRKPVIFYIYDLDDYLSRSRQMYCDYLEEVPGPFARTTEELTDLIFTAERWFEEDEYRKRFESALNFYHRFKDGDSCYRLQNLLLEHSAGI